MRVCAHVCVSVCLCVCITEYYSALREKEILAFVTTRMDLEGIVLSETSQTEKDKYQCDLTEMWNLKKKKKSHTHPVEQQAPWATY